MQEICRACADRNYDYYSTLRAGPGTRELLHSRANLTQIVTVAPIVPSMAGVGNTSVCDEDLGGYPSLCSVKHRAFFTWL